MKENTQKNEPPNEREGTQSTEEEAPTTSQSTTISPRISETPTTNLGTLSTGMEMTTEQELKTSTHSPTTLVAASEVSEATLKAGSSELPGNSTTLEPSKKNASIQLGKSPAKIAFQNGATTTENPSRKSDDGKRYVLGRY